MAALDQRLPDAENIAKTEPGLGQSVAAKIFAKCAWTFQYNDIGIFFLPEAVMFKRI